MFLKSLHLFGPVFREAGDYFDIGFQTGGTLNGILSFVQVERIVRKGLITVGATVRKFLKDLFFKIHDVHSSSVKNQDPGTKSRFFSFLIMACGL
jgi:hypothetical protein